MLKFNFKNIGKISEAQIELGKLTILCGPNNSNKTYLSYIIYGFLKQIKLFFQCTVDDDFFENLMKSGTAEYDLMSNFDNFINDIHRFSKKFSENLASYFSVKREIFGNSLVNFDIKKEDLILDSVRRGVAIFGDQCRVFFHKEKDSTKVKFVYQERENENDFGNKQKVPKDILRKIVGEQLANIFLMNSLPRPFVITSERTGIELFYKYIEINKRLQFDNADNMEIEDSRFCVPINDNIEVMKEIDEIVKKRSSINDGNKLVDAMTDIMGGRCIAQDKQLFFKVRDGEKECVVPMQLSSSSVKSLYLLELYLRHLASVGDILIIDEPELNLHPDNQRKIASLLVKLVNSGVNVFITTHSDYVVREINNRIVLGNSSGNEKKMIMERYGVTDDELLKLHNVVAYCVNKNGDVKQIPVTSRGVELEEFDAIINSANEFSDDVYNFVWKP